MAQERVQRPATIKLRDSRPQDFRQLWAIDQQCFARGIAYSQRELAYYMGMRGAFTVVAEGEEEKADAEGKRDIVGFLVGQRLARGLGHVVTIDVLPMAQRAGIGSLLLLECERRLKAQGCTGVCLETAVDNQTALRFYKRHGYVVLKTIPRYYLGSIDALLLGKRFD